jgi:hypothetical protein
MDVQIFSFPDNNTLKVRRRKLEEEEEINDVSAERCGDFQSNFYSVRWLGGRVKAINRKSHLFYTDDMHGDGCQKCRNKQKY